MKLETLTLDSFLELCLVETTQPNFLLHTIYAVNYLLALIC